MRTGTFLLAAIDGGGTAPPALGLAAELVRRGHAVTVLADPTLARAARSAGCGFTPWRTALHFESVADQTALIEGAEGRNRVRRLVTIRQVLKSGMTARFAEEVVAAAGAERVDAVLAESMPGMLIGAQATGRPAAALMANVYLVPTPGLPLMGTGWRPGTGVAGRARDALAVAAARRLARGFAGGPTRRSTRTACRRSGRSSSCSTGAPRSWC